MLKNDNQLVMSHSSLFFVFDFYVKFNFDSDLIFF